MRKIFLALVGLAGIVCAGRLLPVGLNENTLDTLVTYTILGHVPGTNIQLGFTSATIVGLSLVLLLIGVAILRSQGLNPSDLFLQRVDSDNEDEPLSPFDNDELIMIAAETDQLVSRHQRLPIQLQLFEQI